MRTAIVAGVCCLLAAPVLAVVPSQAAKPPVPPAAAKGLGGHAKPSAKVEDFAAYVPQTSCHPKWRKGVRKFRNLVMRTYPWTQDWGSKRDCTDDGTSEHLDGRAWDWHVDVDDPKEFAAATDLLNWLMAKGPDGKSAYWARRLGIMYIGYNSRIWGSYRASEGWRKLGNSNPHTDHVHFSFSWAGAFGRTSFWDGTRAKEDYGPCRVVSGEPAPLYDRRQRNRRPCGPAANPGRSVGSTGRLLWRGSESKQVLALQTALRVPGANGYFGPKTMRAVAAYQRKHRLLVTGAVDSATRSALVADGVFKR